MISTDGPLPGDIIVFFRLVWQLGAFLAHSHHLCSINYICIIVAVQVVYYIVSRGKVLLVAWFTVKVTPCNREVSPFKKAGGAVGGLSHRLVISSVNILLI